MSTLTSHPDAPIYWVSEKQLQVLDSIFEHLLVSDVPTMNEIREQSLSQVTLNSHTGEEIPVIWARTGTIPKEEET